MRITARSYILLNLLPYILFGGVGIIANIIEYRYGNDVLLKPVTVLWIFWVLPIFVFGLSIVWESETSKMFRAGIGLILALLFIVIGIAMMFGFTFFRHWLGMPI